MQKLFFVLEKVKSNSENKKKENGFSYTRFIFSL